MAEAGIFQKAVTLYKAEYREKYSKEYRKKFQIEPARRMLLKEKYTIEEIADILNLTVEEVLKLQVELLMKA